ncbi:MAG: DNA replication and repair protein RecF [Saprospiraceae bacterium]
MQLSAFRLINFKNYARRDIECPDRLTCFVGPNGVGKTNLLAAVYYLCMGKDQGGLPDSYAIRHGEDFFRLDGMFVPEPGAPVEKIVIKAGKKRRKAIERQGVAYERLADHVGRYPVVMIVPDDIQLVHEGSETRRRLLDNTLCQTDPAYLRALLQYNQLLRQRNALLKQYDGRAMPEDLLEVYDAQMAAPVDYIYKERSMLAASLAKYVQDTYAVLADHRETVELNYRSQLADRSWKELCRSRREKDRVLQRTTAGIHRDDLVFNLGGYGLRREASQGQLKSFVLALKLGQYRSLAAARSVLPILLLDDIFDKLDAQRVARLLEFILAGETFGQVFISDTNPERIVALVDSLPDDFTVKQVVMGIERKDSSAE